MLKPVTVAAGLLAASATAFLVPPEVAKSDPGLVGATAVDADKTWESVAVKVNCPGCPVVINGHRAPKFMEDKPHHLELTFNVEHQTGADDRLLVNGFELYPNPDPLTSVLAASPLLDSPPWGGKGKGGWGGPWGKWGHHKDGEKHGHHRGGPPGPPGKFRPEPQPLGFTIHTQTKESVDQSALVLLDFKIIEVGNVFINRIPELHVSLVKDEAGRLLIGNIDKEELAPDANAPTGDDECTTALCKWLTSIFGGKKPCHGQRPDADPASLPAEGGYHHGDMHHGHSGLSESSEDMNRAPEHSWGQLFKNIASHIILPVLIGIVAGVSVSLIGMVVGTLIVSAWRTFVRRPAHHKHHRRHHSGHGHSRRKSTQVEAAIAEEKENLMDNVESVPEDEPPAYEPVAAKKTDAEA